MSNSNKIDVSAVYELFETINNKLDKQTNVSVEPKQIDLSVVNAMTERFENVIGEVRKPTIIKHKHKHWHTIEIGSSKIFLSMLIMVWVIFGLAFAIGNQRETINQYKNNDLKYRCIKMQGQANEENLYKLERWFEYPDTIKIIRKQVERYEELVKEQAEKIERARQNAEEVKKLQQEAETLIRKSK
jgi:hypothetical protein